VNTPSVQTASLSLAPDAAKIIVDSTVQLSASALDATGKLIPGKTITFASSSPLIAGVSSAGLVKGLSPGIATITAAADGKSKSSTITVDTIPLAFQVSASSTLIYAGSCGSSTAHVSSSMPNTVFASSNTNVARVDNGGLVTAVAAGTTVISATARDSRVRNTDFTVSGCDSQATTITLTPATDSGVVGARLTVQAAIANQPQNSSLVWTTSNSAFIAVVGKDTTFATPTPPWGTGFHKGGEVYYWWHGKATICAKLFVSGKPANISGCGEFVVR
jgi:large repetitive protein